MQNVGPVRLCHEGTHCPETFHNHHAFHGLLKLIDSLLAAKPLRHWELADLQTLVGEWLNQMELVSDASGFLDRINQERPNTSAETLRTNLQPKTDWEQLLVDLFLVARQRNRVYSYLAVQEGLDWESSSKHPDTVGFQFSQLLYQIGRAPFLVFRLRFFKFRLRISCDPFISLRKWYDLHVLRQRQDAGWWSRGQSWFTKLLFRGQARLCAWTLRRMVKRLLAAFRTANAASEKPSRRIRSLVRNLLQFFFPFTKNLSRSESDQLLEQIGPELFQQMTRIARAIPPESLADDGYAKWLKIAIGVILNISDFSTGPSAKNREVFRCLRLAMAWGASYPLIDNVLDSHATTQQDQSRLHHELSELFARETPNPPVDADDSTVGVAVDQLRIVLQDAFSNDSEELRNAMQLLLASHVEDSAEKLSSLEAISLTEQGILQLWANSVVKAALVRLVTHCLCGVELTPSRIADLLIGGVLNQFGDDLWDTLADQKADRLTPFTLYLAHSCGPNPYDFLLRYLATLATGVPAGRQIALAMGFLETTHCCLKTFPKHAPAESAKLRTILADTLNRHGQGWNLDTIRGIPHIDPDSLLFRLMTEAFRS
jgi:hypothetical protein